MFLRTEAVQWPMVEHFGFVMRWDEWAAIVLAVQAIGVPLLLGLPLIWIMRK